QVERRQRRRRPGDDIGGPSQSGGDRGAQLRHLLGRQGLVLPPPAPPGSPALSHSSARLTTMVLATACANSDYGCELVNKLGVTGFCARSAEFALDRPLRILVIIIVAASRSRVL